MKSKTSVLIIGAGPTGLILALSLRRHGVPCRIIEKNPAPGQASRAMVVQARTLEFYQQLGLANEIVAEGIPVGRIRLREDEKEFAEISLGEIGGDLSPFPFALCYAQDDHERFLARKLEKSGVKIEWQTELKSFKQEGGRVQATIEKNSVTEEVDAHYLCGCDGAHSSVRRALGLNFPGGTYEQMFYVADVNISDAPKNELSATVGDKSFGLMLPVRRNGMKRLIGVIPSELSGKSALTFEDLRPDIERIHGRHVDEVNWFATYHVHHRVAERFRSGNVFIAGDAGHIHSPAGGQGMNTGIGDAFNLSWKLANVIQGKAEASLLDTYESERMAFARKLVATTDQAFQALVGRGWFNRTLRTWVLPNVLPAATKFEEVRRILFRTVSQIRINYRESSISAGQVGDVHGGDRLPWVPERDRDNYNTQTGLDWRVHVYGNVDETFQKIMSDTGIPIDVFDFTESAKKSGLIKNAAYLLRPDGHVAFACPEQDSRQVLEFTKTIGLHPSLSL